MNQEMETSMLEGVQKTGPPLGHYLPPPNIPRTPAISENFNRVLEKTSCLLSQVKQEVATSMLESMGRTGFLSNVMLLLQKKTNKRKNRRKPNIQCNFAYGDPR
jgi:hypothetical protein